MSNYTTNVRSCRVDFFEPAGKWHTSAAVIFRVGEFKIPAHEALRNAIIDAGYLNLLQHFDCICLNPRHQYGFPICIKAEGRD